MSLVPSANKHHRFDSGFPRWLSVATLAGLALVLLAVNPTAAAVDVTVTPPGSNVTVTTMPWFELIPFGVTACTIENRTMQEIFRGRPGAKEEGFFSGGLGGMSNGTWMTWGCWRKHACLDSIGLANKGEAVCYKRNSADGSWMLWGLQREVGVGCSDVWNGTAKAPLVNSSSSSSSSPGAPADGGHGGALAGARHNFTENLARRCGEDGRMGCGTSAPAFVGWSSGPERAVDGNVNTWIHVANAPWTQPLGGTPITYPWFGVDLGTKGNTLSHLLIKTASWIGFDGRWKANYPVSIYVGDSDDWRQNVPCVFNVTDFGPKATLVSLNGASKLETIVMAETGSGETVSGVPDLPASVIDFSCSATGRWVHVVMNGTDFLRMGEVEVYGNRTVPPPRDRWAATCSRGTYLYKGNCVGCPKGWTTGTAPPSADAGPEVWTGCTVPCSQSMLSDSSTGCKGAWYKGASYPSSNSNIRDCNAICGNVGKSCQDGGARYGWGLERSQKVWQILGETASCAIKNSYWLIYDNSKDSVWAVGYIKRTCGACAGGDCRWSVDGPHYDDASGDPSFYNSTSTTGPWCSGGHGDLNHYCVCA